MGQWKNQSDFLKLKLRSRRQTRETFLYILISVAGLWLLSVITGVTLLNSPFNDDNILDEVAESHDHLLLRRSVSNETTSTLVTPNVTTPPTREDKTALLASIGDFPPDLFTTEQLAQGAVLLHAVGLVYMFIALAIVCDEFFVPALEVIIKRWGISEDVAGATFMAAGGSAPELFTSLFGVFISRNSVGIGTIVGSAVFNILFVIGMCAVFSKEVLQLTWWPLFRDVVFYSVSLLVLIGCYIDPVIHSYEAVLLLLCYASYVTFMRFNGRAELAFKKFLRKHRLGGSTNRIEETSAVAGSVPASSPNRSEREGGALSPPDYASAVQSTPGSARGQRSGNSGMAVIRPGSAAKYRHSIVQLMIRTIDPLAVEGHFEDRALRLHAITSLQVTLNPDHDQNGNVDSGRIKIEGSGTYYANNGGSTSTALAGPGAHRSTPLGPGAHRSTPLGPGDSLSSPVSRKPLPAITDVEMVSEAQVEPSSVADSSVTIRGPSAGPPRDAVVSPLSSRASGPPGSGGPMEDDEENEPLDMSWPATHRKRLTYILLAPIVFPLWLSLPDVRKETKEKYYPGSFIGSIVWIAIYAYLMLWWASTLGVTLGLPIEVMGLTVIAAGTSVPDLLTSVIVARKGYGDMAVSSSIGSNIFDITVGLPFPWILGCIANAAQGIPPWVNVSAEGLICSIILLFIMLILVVVTIACFNWRLNKWLGVTMFGLYIVFLVISILLAYGFIPCIELPGQ